MELRNLLDKTCPQLVSDANWNWYLSCLQSSCNYQVFVDLVEDYSKERIRVGIERHSETSLVTLSDLPIKGITLDLKGTVAKKALIGYYYVKVNGVEPKDAYMDITIASGSNNKYFQWAGETPPDPPGSEVEWSPAPPAPMKVSDVEWESCSVGYTSATGYNKFTKYNEGINAFIIEPGIQKGQPTAYYKAKYKAYFNTNVTDPQYTDSACSAFIAWLDQWELTSKVQRRNYILVIFNRGQIYINTELRKKLLSLGGRLPETYSPLQEGYCYATVLSDDWSTQRAYEQVSDNQIMIPIQDGTIVKCPVRPVISKINFRFGNIAGNNFPQELDKTSPYSPSNTIVEQDKLRYNIPQATLPPTVVEKTHLGVPFHLSSQDEIIRSISRYNENASKGAQPLYAVGKSPDFPYEYYDDLEVAVLAASARLKVLWKIEKVLKPEGWVYLCHPVNKFILDKRYLISEGQYHIEEDYNEDALLVREGTVPVFYTVYYDVVLTKLDWHPNGFNGKFKDLFGSDIQDIFSVQSLASVTKMCSQELTTLEVNSTSSEVVEFKVRNFTLLSECIISTSLLPGDIVSFSINSNTVKLEIIGVAGNMCTYSVIEGTLNILSATEITNAHVIRTFCGTSLGEPLQVKSSSPLVQSIIERSLV